MQGNQVRTFSRTERYITPRLLCVPRTVAVRACTTDENLHRVHLWAC